MTKHRNRPYVDLMADEDIRSSPLEEATSPVQREITPPIRKGVIVNSRVVNVREAPNKEANVATIMDRGDEVEIIKEEGGWYLIQVEDIHHVKHEVGYILSDFCKEV